MIVDTKKSWMSEWMNKCIGSSYRTQGSEMKWEKRTKYLFQKTVTKLLMSTVLWGFFLSTVNLKSEGHNQCSSAIRFILSARVLFISLWSWKDYNENAQRKKGGTIVNSFLWQVVSAFSHSLAFIQTKMTNVLQWIDEIFLSGYGIKIKQYCTDFSLWVLSSSHNCWTLAELLTPLTGNKAKLGRDSTARGLWMSGIYSAAWCHCQTLLVSISCQLPWGLFSLHESAPFPQGHTFTVS